MIAWKTIRKFDNDEILSGNIEKSFYKKKWLQEKSSDTFHVYIINT